MDDDNEGMHQRNYLIADDVDDAKIARMKMAIETADPMANIHVARSVREAMGLIGSVEFDAGAIDFDFLGEPETGADIVAALRTRNARSAIACVTARTDSSFEEAESRTLAAGADAAFSSAYAFEGELATMLS